MGRVADHRGTLSTLVKALWGPALATAVAFALLVALGAWQLERLAWKDAVLAGIAQGEALPPIPLPPDPAPFSKVEVRGMLHDVGLYAVAVRATPEGEREGAFRLGVIEPPGASAVLVNEGWVPDGTPPDPAPRPASVVGYVQPAEPPGLFTPRGDAVTRRVFAPDPPSIAAALGLPTLAPFLVVALGDAAPGTYPQPAQHLPQPPNNHLQYALTWFSLAAVLLGIFVSYAMQRVRAAC